MGPIQRRVIHEGGLWVTVIQGCCTYKIMNNKYFQKKNHSPRSHSWHAVWVGLLLSSTRITDSTYYGNDE
jgi:hypothetical protein